MAAPMHRQHRLIKHFPRHRLCNLKRDSWCQVKTLKKNFSRNVSKERFTRFFPAAAIKSEANYVWAINGRCRGLSNSCQFSRKRLVLGIETSCDDTGAAVVDEDGRVLGEALNSQTQFHVE